MFTATMLYIKISSSSTCRCTCSSFHTIYLRRMQNILSYDNPSFLKSCPTQPSSLHCFVPCLSPFIPAWATPSPLLSSAAFNMFMAPTAPWVIAGRYFSLFESYLNYGTLLWGFAKNKLLQKIEIQLKRCIRNIALTKKTHNKELELLKLTEKMTFCIYV